MPFAFRGTALELSDKGRVMLRLFSLVLDGQGGQTSNARLRENGFRAVSPLITSGLFQNVVWSHRIKEVNA